MEVWKDVVGYEGLYQVSNLGRVKSLPRNGTHTNKEKEMTVRADPKGYMRLCLCKDGKGKNVKVHRLVAEAFIPNPANLPQVNHKDEDKRNNCVWNLEWCDNRYNCVYNNRMKKIAQKVSRRVRCLETDIVYESVADAARKTGLTYSNIVYVCQGKFKQIKGYHFKYEDY